MDNSRRSNGPDRGNSYSRRARKHYLLTEYGDGETCECIFCGAELNFDTVTADRITPGKLNGSYQRDNLVPACGPCNFSRGDTPIIEFMVKVGPVKLAASIG
jgi:5-methylcytosine-specific restriction endonuclease McrA